MQKGMMKMSVGDRLTFNAQHPEGGAIFKTSAVVEIMCDKFCVLNNGKYRFCAFYRDLKQGNVIVL